MQTVSIILGYLKWHYGNAIYSLSTIWRNFLFFVIEFFSIKLLFKNFFDPWKKMTDPYPKFLEIKKYLSALIVNIIVILIGIIMRTFLILVGLSCLFLLILLYPVAIIIWLLLPLIVLILIVSGLYLIIK